MRRLSSLNLSLRYILNYLYLFIFPFTECSASCLHIVILSMSSALLPARDTRGAAGPAAGAGPVPEAGPATAGPVPGPTPDPSPTPPGTRRPRRSPRLVPDLDPGPGPNPSQSPNPSLDPEAPALPAKESPGRDPKASPSQQQRMEAKPRRAQSQVSDDHTLMRI